MFGKTKKSRYRSNGNGCELNKTLADRGYSLLANTGKFDDWPVQGSIWMR
jgi:hypothetical protein